MKGGSETNEDEEQNGKRWAEDMRKMKAVREDQEGGGGGESLCVCDMRK